MAQTNNNAAADGDYIEFGVIITYDQLEQDFYDITDERANCANSMYFISGLLVDMDREKLTQLVKISVCQHGGVDRNPLYWIAHGDCGVFFFNTDINQDARTRRNNALRKVFLCD